MDAKATTGLNLSDQELDEATRRLAFFAPTGSRQYVEELHEFLAQHALASLPMNAWLGHEIFSALRKLTGMRVEYEELLAALQRLLGQKVVTCTSENAFSPDARFAFEHSERRSEILQATKDQKLKENLVISDWKQEISTFFPRLSSSDIDLLETDLREYVYRLASHNSVDSLLMYYTGKEELDTVANQLDADTIDQILPARPEILMHIRSQVLPAFFRTASQERKKFIAGLLQATFILHMIQLDPKCSALVQAQVRGGVVYLDTNFIFRLLGLHSPEMFFASRTILDLSKQLNYKIHITPITLREYRYALDDDLRRMGTPPQLPHDILQLVIDNADNEDPIIAYYRNMAERQKSKPGVWISPIVYRDYFAQLEDRLEPYGITVSDQNCEVVKADTERLNLETSHLIRFYEESRSNKNRINGHELNPHVAEHDAFHRLLILSLRGNSDSTDFFDEPYWFLTCDTKLPSYDRSRRYSEKIRMPFCVMSAQWLQTLRPFAPRLSAEAVVDSISSPLLRSFNPIPNSIIIDVASRLELYNKYSPAVGKYAMQRQFLLQFMNAETEEEKREIIESAFADYAADLENMKELAEHRQVEAEVKAAELESEIKRLQHQVVQTDKERIQNQEAVATLQRELSRLATELEEEKNIRRKAEIDVADKQSVNTAKQQEVETLKNAVLSLSERDKHTRRMIYVISIVAAYALVLLVVQPWLRDALWWLVLSGLLIIVYLSTTVLFKPWEKGRAGRLFTIGIPFIIVATIALPFGHGDNFLQLIGTIANVGGVVGSILMLFQD